MSRARIPRRGAPDDEGERAGARERPATRGEAGVNALSRQLQTIRADARLTVDELAAVVKLPPDVMWVLLHDGHGAEQVPAAPWHDVRRALTDALFCLRRPVLWAGGTGAVPGSRGGRVPPVHPSPGDRPPVPAPGPGAPRSDAA